MANATAKCERTGKDISLRDGFFTADPFTGEWSFVGKDAPEKSGEYNVAVDDLLSSPKSLVDWLAHLHEKTWFDPEKFFQFFERFRESNGLYN
jgi:hypothetical protein